MACGLSELGRWSSAQAAPRLGCETDQAHRQRSLAADLDEEDGPAHAGLFPRGVSSDSLSDGASDGLLAGRAAREGSARSAGKSAKLASAGLALLLLLGVAALAARGGRSATVRTSDQSSGNDLVGLAENSSCHTAVQGEECYGSVVWQMTSKRGVTNHPEWNSGVKEDSTFEEFQAWMHKQNPGVCPQPCPAKEASAVLPGSRAAPEGEATGGRSVQPGLRAQARAQDAKEENSKCHTAEKGEACHTSVLWAMTDGIFSHPEWYDGLTKSAEFEDFQAAVHRLDGSICPQPCSPSHLTKSTVEAVTVAQPPGADTAADASSPNAPKVRERCEQPLSGDSCDTDVKWAKTIGIFLHPEWYDPLTADASSKEFQMVIHTRNKSACPRPCGLNISKLVAPGSQDGCRTASEGDPCYESVTWAMHDGISVHPEWYPGLTKTSSFEEFQAVVHRLRPASCALPCECRTAQRGDACYRKIQEETGGSMDPKSRFQAQLKLHRAGAGQCAYPCKEVRPKGSPSLYCFSVVSRFNPEEMRLIEAQRSLRASIFDCDESAVLSTEPVSMGDDVTVLTFTEAAVGVSDVGTAGNAELFMNAWEAIKKSGRWARYDWIVKTDPDAVLLPRRLRMDLALHASENGVYVQNCDRYGPSLFGALEAFSHVAIQKLFDSGTECRDHLNWQEWGEDVYMALCMDHIGVSKVLDQKLIGDARCYGSDCGDGTSASYHPFKSVSDWTNCWHSAAGGE